MGIDNADTGCLSFFIIIDDGLDDREGPKRKVTGFSAPRDRG